MSLDVFPIEKRGGRFSSQPSNRHLLVFTRDFFTPPGDEEQRLADGRPFLRRPFQHIGIAVTSFAAMAVRRDASRLFTAGRNSARRF